MPSSSRIAHRMRSSGLSNNSNNMTTYTTYTNSEGANNYNASYSNPFDGWGESGSVSSFIEGLSPHPSVHTPSFLSSTPPPLVQGLERHPDAPKPLTSSFSSRNVITEDIEDDGLPISSSTTTSQLMWGSKWSASASDETPSSFFQSRPSFGDSELINDARAPPLHVICNDIDSSSPTSSVLSSSSASSSSDSDSNGSSQFSSFVNESLDVNPISFPFPEPEVHVSDELLVNLEDEIIEPTRGKPTLSCLSVNPFSDFNRTTSTFAADWFSPASKAPAVSESPVSPGAISRMIMEYLRGIDS